MQTIELNVEGGSLTGSVIDFRTLDLNQGFDQPTNSAGALLNALYAERQCVGLLSDISVDVTVRGRGIGKALIRSFIESAEEAGATCFFLIADVSKEQAEGFVLTDWYESLGFFKTQLKTREGLLMVMPERLVDYTR